MKKLILIIVILFSMKATSQTTKIIQLDKNDAEQILNIHNNLLEIDNKINSFTTNIIKNYLLISYNSNQTVIFNFMFKEGWNSSFTYSEDYKFIVSDNKQNVLPLTESDSKTINNLYSEQKLLNSKIGHWHDIIVDKYLSDKSSKNSFPSINMVQGIYVDTSGILSGWQNGFDYSNDFKFIIAKDPAQLNIYPTSWLYSNPVSSSQF